MYDLAIDTRTLALAAALCLILAVRSRHPTLLKALAVAGWAIVIWNTYRSWF